MHAKTEKDLLDSVGAREPSRRADVLCADCISLRLLQVFALIKCLTNAFTGQVHCPCPKTLLFEVITTALLGKQILNDCIRAENEDFGQRRFLGNILRFAKGNRLIRLGEYRS